MEITAGHGIEPRIGTTVNDRPLIAFTGGEATTPPRYVREYTQVRLKLAIVAALIVVTFAAALVGLLPMGLMRLSWPLAMLATYFLRRCPNCDTRIKKLHGGTRCPACHAILRD